ncbi:MAG: hypothetical protein R2718_00870 [Solirubrobacterales bacterium]
MALNATARAGDSREESSVAQVLELADGTRLVPEGEAKPARLDGDRDHVFTLADVCRKGAEPFAGYVRLS